MMVYRNPVTMMLPLITIGLSTDDHARLSWPGYRRLVSASPTRPSFYDRDDGRRRNRITRSSSSAATTTSCAPGWTPTAP